MSDDVRARVQRVALAFATTPRTDTWTQYLRAKAEHIMVTEGLAKAPVFESDEDFLRWLNDQ